MLWLLDFPPLRHAAGYVLNAAGGGKALAPLALTPNWHPFLLLAFVAAALIVLQDFVLLFNPTRTKLRAGALLIANTLMVVGACLILPSRSFIVTHASTPAYELAARALNQTAFISLVVFAVAVAVAAAFNLRTLLQRAPKADLNISYEA
jgi:hypothetical protein